MEFPEVCLPNVLQNSSALVQETLGFGLGFFIAIL